MKIDKTLPSGTVVINNGAIYTTPSGVQTIKRLRVQVNILIELPKRTALAQNYPIKSKY